MSQIVRWSDDPAGLTREDCARKGIEALAGLLISRDIFDTNRFPDAHFCACAEIYHAVSGMGDNFDDHIAATFRVVEIKDGTYPLVGQASVRMILQPLDDGNVSARWNAVDRPSSTGASPAARLLADDLEDHSCVCPPFTLGTIPAQEEEDTNPPSFLILKDPGAGWQIWRRFMRMVESSNSQNRESFREESYTMVYPLLSPEMNWRFRVYDEPGGGARVEIDSGRRS